MSANTIQTEDNHLGRHAVVMGGSMAGLLAARVLSQHFEAVTLLEKDRFPLGNESRKGVPQGQQPHALLAKGYEILSRLFPDLPEALRENGAEFVEMGTGFRWHHAGAFRVQTDLGLRGPFMTRPLLERLVRERVLALPNVYAIAACDVRGLLAGQDKTCITGVRVQRADSETEETLHADLVVDATGRGSRSPGWLEELGYARPAEETIRINMGYTTRIYPREPGDFGGAHAFYITPDAPEGKRCGAAFPIEGNRWLVCMAGWLGDHAPTTEAGFLEYARSLPVPDIADLIARRQPLSEFRTFKYPYNLRRRYEKLTRFPDGYLVLGDALCSFNPIYGQGMTSAALSADALGECLRERTTYGDLSGLAGRFFPKAARRVDVPWRMAAGADFLYPEVEGQKAPGTDLINAYLRRLQRATHHDPVIYRAFGRVMHLLAEPTSLFAPSILWRVLWGSRRAAGPQPAPALRLAPNPLNPPSPETSA